MSLASDPSSINHLSFGLAHPASRVGGAGDLSSPWAQAIRGEPGPSSPPRPASVCNTETSDRSPPPVEKISSLSAPPPLSESPHNGGNSNAAAAAASGKKPAWNMPSSGSNEAGALMGADSWPPLSESTRASPKLSSSDSLKSLSVGSIPARPKPNSNHPNPNSTPNHAASVRQKSDTNPNSSIIDGPPPSLSPPASAKTAHIIPDKQSGSEPSPKDHPNKSNRKWDHSLRSSGFTPQPHGSYGGNRRGNSGGVGSYHGAYGSRRGHERGAYDWNPPRGFSGRDAHMLPPLQQERGHSRPFPMQPLPASAPFMSPRPQIRPFISPMGFVEIPPPMCYIPVHPPLESLRNMPFVAHQVPPAIPPTMFVTATDHQRTVLLKQIEYYFSSDNLCKDIYLRQKMDDQGWVPISLIAGFNRVKQLTNNMRYMLDTIQSSEIVEVQGDKIRRRNDWVKWILPSPPSQYSTSSSPSSPATSNYDSLAARMHGVGLGEGAVGQNSRRGPNWY